MQFEQLIIPGKLNSGEFLKNKKIANLMRSEYGTLLQETFEGLRREELYISDFHGSDHVERVLMMGALICHEMALPLRDAELVLFCCAYHDIARVNDSGDKEHGPRAAQLMCGEKAYLIADFTEQEKSIVKTAISTHSRDDGDFSIFADRYSVGEKELDRAWIITQCLKDADNLDRHRVGDFDPRFLRTKAGKELVKDSLWVFDHFGRKPYIWWKKK